MTTEVSISESAIAEETAAAIVPVVTTLYLERRPVMIYGTAAYRAELGNDFAGQQVVAQLEKIGLDIEPDGKGGLVRDPSSMKILREVWPTIRGTPGTTINIYAGYQSISADDAIVWTGPFPFVLGSDVSVQPLIEGAYLSLKFTSTGQPPWALLSVDADIDNVGEVYTQ